MIQKLLPAICPSCGKVLKVTRLKCGECQTTVEGDYDLPVMSRLEPEEHQFIYYLGGEIALMIGMVLILAMSLLGFLSHTHFDGVLDGDFDVSGIRRFL